MRGCEGRCGGARRCWMSLKRVTASGAKFARLAGIKYATFAGWVLKRRQQGRRAVKTTPGSPVNPDDSVVSAGPVRMFEALMEDGNTEGRVGARGVAHRAAGRESDPG